MLTYSGYVENLIDAVLIFEACRLGRLQTVPRRLNDEERRSIRSGCVFVWNEKESGIRRWTDRFNWSASKTADDFLVYSEWSLPRRKTSKSISDSHGNRPTLINEIDFKPVVFRDGNQTKFDPPPSTSNIPSFPQHKNINLPPNNTHSLDPLANNRKPFHENLSFGNNKFYHSAPRNMYNGHRYFSTDKRSISLNLSESTLLKFIERSRFKKKMPPQIGNELINGLIKKTISIVDRMGNKNHLVCYYSQADLNSGKLKTPSNDKSFPITRISEGVYEFEIYERIREIKLKGNSNTTSTSENAPNESPSDNNTSDYSQNITQNVSELNMQSYSYHENQPHFSSVNSNRKRHDLSIHPSFQSDGNFEKYRKKTSNRNISDCRKRIEGMNLIPELEHRNNLNDGLGENKMYHRPNYRSHSSNYSPTTNTIMESGISKNSIRAISLNESNKNTQRSYPDISQINHHNRHHSFNKIDAAISEDEIRNNNFEAESRYIPNRALNPQTSHLDHRQNNTLNHPNDLISKAHKKHLPNFEKATDQNTRNDDTIDQRFNPNFNQVQKSKSKPDINLTLPPINSFYSNIADSHLPDKAGVSNLCDIPPFRRPVYRNISDPQGSSFSYSSDKKSYYHSQSQLESIIPPNIDTSVNNFKDPFSTDFPILNPKLSPSDSFGSFDSYKNGKEKHIYHNSIENSAEPPVNQPNFLPSIQTNLLEIEPPKSNLNSEDARQLSLLKRMF
ncbi:cAMP-independent regulatory protein pac2 [Smittium culicis]|uniref:cAMP-independent regulatory protein pac2 n=1 Tax=Smittium culicis TaxID=133412 RepID=A0A1R1Y2J5_9FUNG|nr:cAMP-independent regulatory protein pac2 [Smittium culicis]OMJ23801.1 cAMP-independent regulatory protein pac2 [Smittium culicis]